MGPRCILLLALVSATRLVGTAASQDEGVSLLQRLILSTPGRVAQAGRLADLDGDLVPDLVVQSWYSGSQGMSVWLFSGIDRRLLVRIDPPKGSLNKGYFGQSTLLLKVGWSMPTLVVADPYGNKSNPGGRLIFVDPTLGTTLNTLLAPGGVSLFGWGLLGQEDLNSDGVEDFVVLAAGGSEGHVLAFSGATLQVLWKFKGTFQERIPGPIDWVDDVDGDGLRDVLVASRWYLVGGSRAGRIFILSGATGKLLWLLAGNPGEGMAADAATVGDANADGVREFVYLTGNPAGAGFSTQVVIQDGASLQEHARWDYSQYYGSLAFLERSGDRDGDGQDDIMFHGDLGSLGVDIVCVSSNTGRVLWIQRYDQSPPAPVNGLSDGSDLTGDGLPETLISVNENGVSRLDFYQTDALRVVAAPPGNPSGSSPEKALELTCPSLPGGAYVVLYSWSADSGTPIGRRRLPLDPTSLLNLSATRPVLGRFDGTGRALVPVGLPQLGGRFPGLRAHACFVGLDPSDPLGVRAISNAVDVKIK